MLSEGTVPRQAPPDTLAAPPLLDRAAVQRLVPHQGAMCLLDAIAAWDATRIVALALSHRDPHNPLRREGDGALPAVCGVEYALQAMAAHGALRAAGRPQPAGYLSSLRGVEIGAERLDDLPGPLLVTAEALATEARGFIYRFAVEGGGRRLLAGQAAIILPEE